MEERAKFALVAMVLMVASGISWFLPIRLLSEGGVALAVTVLAVLPVAVTAISVLYISNEFRSIRAGLPLQDERSRQKWLLSGFYSFLLSSVFTLSLFAYAVYGDVHWTTIQAGEALFAVMTVMASSFLAVRLVLAFRDRGE